jgi:uncharacterized protein
MKWLDIIGAVFLILGGLNWGLYGFFGYNLIATWFGEYSAVSRVFYAFVGLSALYELWDVVFGYKGLQERWCEYPATARH